MKNALKTSFLYYYNEAQTHEGFVGYENIRSRAKIYVILPSINYVNFYASHC